MKKYFLIVCTIILFLLLGIDYYCNASARATFLGMLVMEPEEYMEILENRPEYIDVEKPELELTFNGVKVPYESTKNRYYLPLEVDNPEWENEMLEHHFSNSKGSLYVILDEAKAPDKRSAIREGIEYPVLYVDEEGYATYSIVFTAFPIITINTMEPVAEKEEPITALEKLTEFQIYEQGKFGQYSNFIQESAAYMRVRGNASSGLDKKGYKLTLVNRDNLAENNQLDLLNMRKDDDWILYAIHAEGSKIRDRLSAEVWNDFGRFTQYGTNYGYNLEYVEMIINGEYWGLYGLMPRIDAKQLDLTYDIYGEEKDILYKTNVAVMPDLELMEQAGEAGQTELDPIEIKYPKNTDKVAELWAPMQRLRACIFLENAELLYDMVDVENIIDYWILLQLTYAHDNSWKNQYIVAQSVTEPEPTAEGDGEKYRFLIVPWDFDYSWGLVWKEGVPFSKGYDYDASRILPQPIMDMLLRDNTRDIIGKIQLRWAELRATVLSEENLMSKVDRLEKIISDSGAVAREQNRWPQGLYEENTDHIRGYIADRLEFLDMYIPAMGE